MSDDAKREPSATRGSFDPILREITDDDLRAFLDHVQATQKCGFCGQNALHPIRAQRPVGETGEMEASTKTPAFFAMPIQSDLEEGFEVRIPAYAISCSSCGYTLSLSAIPLMQWKKEQVHGG